jgi:hypothetical protein
MERLLLAIMGTSSKLTDMSAYCPKADIRHGVGNVCL